MAKRGRPSITGKPLSSTERSRLRRERLSAEQQAVISAPNGKPPPRTIRQRKAAVACPLCGQVEGCDHSVAERAKAPRLPRPALCRKRGCYLKPKALFPGWDALAIRCSECPHGAPPLLLDAKVVQVNSANAEVIPAGFVRGRRPHGPVPKPGRKS
jgi:hypothetical protein